MTLRPYKFTVQAVVLDDRDRDLVADPVEIKATDTLSPTEALAEWAASFPALLAAFSGDE